MQWTDLPISSSYGINCPIILSREKDLTADGNVLISLFGHFINSLIVKTSKRIPLKLNPTPCIFTIVNLKPEFRSNQGEK